MSPLDTPMPGERLPHPGSSLHSLVRFQVILSSVLLVQSCSLLFVAAQLYGPAAIVPHDGSPLLRSLVALAGACGVTPAGVITVLQLMEIVALACLATRCHCVSAAIAAWLVRWSLNDAGYPVIYGVDQFVQIGLFYCVLISLIERSANARTLRRASGADDASSHLLWVIRIHLCIVYCSSGIEKATGASWWNGEAVWRAVMRPEGERLLDMGWLSHFEPLVRAAGWGTLIVEAFYPLVLFVRPLQKPWIAATIGMHVGIAVLMSLWTFSAVMIAFNVGAFLTGDSRRTTLQSLSGRSGGSPGMASPVGVPALAGLC